MLKRGERKVNAIVARDAETLFSQGIGFRVVQGREPRTRHHRVMSAAKDFLQFYHPKMDPLAVLPSGATDQ